MKLLEHLLKLRERLLMRDPFLLHLVLNRLEKGALYNKLFSPAQDFKGIVMYESMPLSIWLMEYMLVKFKLDAKAESNIFQGKTGYAYAMVGKHGTVTWLPIQMVHRDSSEVYNLFADKPLLLSSIMKEEVHYIQRVLAQ